MEKIKVENLNERYESLSSSVQNQVFDKKKLKEIKKFFKKEQKKKKGEKKRTVFVLEFKGDIKASQAKELRDEVSALLRVAKKEDEVIVLLESRGGMVHTYGLAASQLKRFKDHGIPLTVCVDHVAASGGYMMACLADKIYAAPFAILGSVGVLAQVPNLHRFLKKHDVDYEEVTAGDYKRTVSLFGEITEKGKKKFQTQIEETHELFKNFVKENRPQVDIDQISTGEYWYGKKALDLKLVDGLKVSDDLIQSLTKEASVYKVHIPSKKKGIKQLAQGALKRWVEEAELSQFPF